MTTFTPLLTIYAARRDGDSLTHALLMYDEAGMRDTLFNFAVTAYHVVDWIKAYRPDLTDLVYALLNGDDAIGACRDLCNASKHVEIDLTGRAYRTYPPALEDVTVSAMTSSPEVPDGWRLKIKLKNGKIYRGEDWADEVVEAWEKFFLLHRI